MTLQLALQTATLVTVIVGFLSLISTINNYRRQATMQVLMKYTERYERILDQFPQDALEARFDAKVLPPQSPQLTLCVLKYLNLCSEEYYLRKHGYLAESVWRIWEGDLKRIIGASAAIPRVIVRGCSPLSIRGARSLSRSNRVLGRIPTANGTSNLVTSGLVC